jgi:hypothetical protein
MRVDPPAGRGFRRLGEIFCDKGYEDFADAWAEYFAPTFLVSRQAMRIRLEKLGLLRRQLLLDFKQMPAYSGKSFGRLLSAPLQSPCQLSKTLYFS